MIEKDIYVPPIKFAMTNGPGIWSFIGIWCVLLVCLMASDAFGPHRDKFIFLSLVALVPVVSLLSFRYRKKLTLDLLIGLPVWIWAIVWSVCWMGFTVMVFVTSPGERAFAGWLFLESFICTAILLFCTFHKKSAAYGIVLKELIGFRKWWAGVFLVVVGLALVLGATAQIQTGRLGIFGRILVAAIGFSCLGLAKRFSQSIYRSVIPEVAKIK